MNKIRNLIVGMLSLISFVSYAYDIEIDGIYYNIDIKEKTASVTYSEEYSFWGTDRYINEITIPSTISYANQDLRVTSIGNEAFYKCEGLSSVIMSSSILKIGKEAFYGCKNLSFVKMSDSIIEIGESAFGYCENLESIQLPNSLVNLGDEAFKKSGLISIVIPNSVIELGKSIFWGCI